MHSNKPSLIYLYAVYRECACSYIRKSIFSYLRRYENMILASRLLIILTMRVASIGASRW